METQQHEDVETESVGPQRDERRKVRVARGIRRDRFGFEAYIHAGGRQRAKRFPPGTSLRIMRVWREQTRAELEVVSPTLVPRPVLKAAELGALKKSPDGWCYIYFIQDSHSHHVKIGRAMDPESRLRSFQTAHHSRLRLVCAFPGHAVIERAIHQRFAHLRIDGGEWFRVTSDLMQLIDELNRGANPVALLW